MAFFGLLLFLLGSVARAGVVKEMIPGVYRPIREKRREAFGLDLCPELITLGDLTAGSTVSISTTSDEDADKGCKAANMVLKAHAPGNDTATDVELPTMARTIRQKYAKQSGTIVTGQLTERIACTVTGVTTRRNRLPLTKRLTFVRPLEPFLEFGVTFKKARVHALFKKRAQTCIYIQDETPLVPNPGTPSGENTANAGNTATHEHPPGTAEHSHSTGTVKIALWAWLGPLIGGLLVCISLLICVLWRYRRDRWYPFNGNQHEDASDSEMFGRLSNQSPFKGNSSSFERAPSGIVFEISNEDGSDPSDDYNNNNNSSSNGNNSRV